jgi:hypothetical protein
MTIPQNLRYRAGWSIAGALIVLGAWFATPAIGPSGRQRRNTTMEAWCPATSSSLSMAGP